MNAHSHHDLDRGNAAAPSAAGVQVPEGVDARIFDLLTSEITDYHGAIAYLPLDGDEVIAIVEEREAIGGVTILHAGFETDDEDVEGVIGGVERAVLLADVWIQPEGLDALAGIVERARVRAAAAKAAGRPA